MDTTVTEMGLQRVIELVVHRIVHGGLFQDAVVLSQETI
jgi:hypothetical protein